MWKWLILLVAGYVLFRLFMNDRRKKEENQNTQNEQLIASGEMVKDPECWAYIGADSGITVRDGDTVHRFCSYDCRDAFVQRIQSERTELPPEQRKNPD